MRKIKAIVTAVLILSVVSAFALKLKPIATVTKKNVYLSDISNCKKKILIATLTANSKIINSNYVNKKIYPLKVDDSNCLVKLKQNYISKKYVIEKAKEFVKNKYEFDDSVEIKICSLSNIKNGDYKLSFKLDDRYILTKTPRLIIQLTGKNTSKTYSVIIKLKKKSAVYVLNKSKKRDELILASDIKKVNLEYHPFNKIAVHPMQLINKICLKYIPMGKLVNLQYVKQKPLIIKKNKVDVTLSGKNINMGFKAVSCENGWLGNTIKLKNLSSKKVFTAIVTGKNKAKIVLMR